MTFNPADPANKASVPSRVMNTGGRLIRWENGSPVPVYSPPLNKQQVSDLVTSAMSCEYVGDIDPQTGEPINFEARFAGMTNAEVMAIRLAEKAASGHDKSITEILDRVLGKPKQSVESVGVRMNFRDYLDMLDKQEKANDSAVVDIMASDSDVLNDMLNITPDDKYACLDDL